MPHRVASIGWVLSGCAALCLLSLWLWRGHRRVEGPSCRRCGYDVRGLPSSICPECGSNLDVVGIARPGSVLPAGVRVRTLYWTLIMAMFSPAVAHWGTLYGPGYRYETGAYQLAPKSGAYATADIFYDGQGIGSSAPVETVKCVIDPPNRISVILEVYSRGLGYSCPDKQWRQVRKESGFDESVVLMCLRTGAVNTSREDVQAEAAELYRIIRGIAEGTGRTVSPVNFVAFPPGSTGFRSVQTPDWMPYVYLGICALIWFAGCRWIAATAGSASRK